MSDTPWLRRSRVSERAQPHFPLRPAERDRIDNRPSLVARVANVLRAHTLDTVALERAFLDHDRSLAINLPRPRRIDRLAVHFHPGADTLENSQFLRIDRAVRFAWNIDDEG